MSTYFWHLVYVSVISWRVYLDAKILNLLKKLDLILVGDECSLVDAIAADQQLIVQGKCEISQAQLLIQREIQSLHGG